MLDVIDGKPLVEIRKDDHCKFISHYYLAMVKDGYNNGSELCNDFEIIPQKNEISSIRFVDINEAPKLIRSYFTERINVLYKLKNILTN